MGKGHALDHVPVLWLVARLLAAAILLLWRSHPVAWCTLAIWEETKPVERTEEQKSWFSCREGDELRDQTESEGGSGRFGRCRHVVRVLSGSRPQDGSEADHGVQGNHQILARQATERDGSERDPRFRKTNQQANVRCHPVQINRRADRCVEQELAKV